ncbi:hypothetical protein LCGC14_1576990, partial [marine sediment metagenome]
PTAAYTDSRLTELQATPRPAPTPTPTPTPTSTPEPTPPEPSPVIAEAFSPPEIDQPASLPQLTPTPQPTPQPIATLKPTPTPKPTPAPVPAPTPILSETIVLALVRDFIVRELEQPGCNADTFAIWNSDHTWLVTCPHRHLNAVIPISCTHTLTLIVFEDTRQIILVGDNIPESLHDLFCGWPY